MLLSITEKCRMGCTHCMDDAKADCNKFMSYDVFKRAIEFNFQYDKTLTITGGEPTEHPDFWKLMYTVAHKMKSDEITTVTTNGMNLNNNDIPIIKELNSICKGHILWQVSSIPEYYPLKVDLNKKIFQMEEFVIATEIERLYPLGRAKDHSEWDFSKVKGTKCFNIRSFIRSTGDFGLSIKHLRSMFKFCTPQISYDGHIKLGESTLCPNVAHIDDDEMHIVMKCCSFKCQGCKEILDKLPQIARNAIGEE